MAKAISKTSPNSRCRFNIGSSRKRGNKKNTKKQKQNNEQPISTNGLTLKALKREMEAVIILGQREEVMYPKGQRQLTMG
jgi:hypothetical protein